jgi:hypothetical protein
MAEKMVRQLGMATWRELKDAIRQPPAWRKLNVQLSLGFGKKSKPQKD